MNGVKKNLLELLAHSAKTYSSHIALSTTGPEAKRWTYQDLFNEVSKATAKISALNLKAESPVILLHEAGPQWLIHFFAVLGANHVVVPLPDSTPLPYIMGAAQLTGASAILASDLVKSKLPQTLPLSIYTQNELKDFDETVKSTATRETLAVMAFTSGSTDMPRIVQLTHGNILANLESFLQVRQSGPTDALLSILPPTHLFQLVVGEILPLACGSRIVYAQTMLPNRILQAIREEKITYTLVVPGLLRILFQQYLEDLVEKGISEEKWLKASEREIMEYLYKYLDDQQLYNRTKVIRELIGDSLKAFVIGGASINPLWGKILVALGIDLELGYGLTEASPVVTLGSSRDMPDGSVGKPLHGIEVKISEEGEILVRGKNIMRGYLNNPTETAKSLRDGWLYTGDRGHIDSEGHLFIDGRIKEAMVNEGGETIYPDEVEPHYGDSSFQEFCVTPLPGPHGNDIPVLIAVPRILPIEKDSIATRFRELRKKASSRHKVFGLILIDHPIPRTALGKPKRRELAATISKGMTEPWVQVTQSPNFVQ